MATHTSPYSGAWYPGDPSDLQALTSKLFRSAQQRSNGPIRSGGLAFVVPHAGLQYSGTVAASVYRHLEALHPRRILLLGFPHHGGRPGLWIPDVDRFETPLGAVEVDRETVRELTAQPEFQRTAESRLCDHSIEIQLPLLQRSVPDARIVPIYVCHPSQPVREAAGRILAAMLSADTVLLASTDLTHYGRAFGYQPFPVDSAVSERLRDLDSSVMEAIGSLSPELFFQVLRETEATVCGYEPVGLLLTALRHWTGDVEVFAETLDYQTSGEITGDYSHSVSYAGLGFFPYRSFSIDAEDQQALLLSARRTLENYQATGARKPVPSPLRTPSLERRAAVFVTLHKDGALRGCVGRCSSLDPLGEAVPDLTLAAALEDSRFEPLAPSESGIEIEISVLSPLKRAENRYAFRVNEHGAVLRAGARQGLLLPQVATERGWSAAQFFEALARKTGVRLSVYDDPATRLFVFRAQVIR